MNPQIQNQEFMLKESIKHFLTSYHSGSSDYSSFESIFFRLIQTMLDPPLEVTWFYSAITFHAAKSSSQNSPSTRVLIAKDLLNLLISCSNLSSASKKIGLLAPVIYELYNIVCDSRKRGLSVKMEVDKLVEDMFSYVMMSAAVYDYGNGDVKSDNAVVCFEDLVRVWTTDRGGGSCNFADNSRVFFPLLSDGTWKGVNVRCGVRELVGIVLCELFFLKLYLSFGSGMCTEDFLKDKQDQAVQTIKGFRNSYFIGLGLFVYALCLLNVELCLRHILRQNLYADLPNINTQTKSIYFSFRLAMNLINGQIPPAICDDLLKSLISFFLSGYPRNVSSFDDLLSAFDSLIGDLKDPPLEVIWFYGAVAFHSSRSAFLPPPGKPFVAKKLLELLNSWSCSCSVVKKVAVIAPVLYLLYHLALNFSERDPCLREEIGILVEGIVSYISICCSQYLEEGERGSDGLGAYILDLIRVWTVDQIRESPETDVLAFFFPNLNNDFQQEGDLLGYLAGVVMNEAFSLRLYLKISSEISKEDLLGEMLKLAIQTIKGFQNFYFLDMLLKMLLEPCLPVASLLSSEDAVILHKVLYDAVILVDYSFYSGRWAHSSDCHSKKLALLWVLVADRAIQFARANNDQARANSYLNAFRESQLMDELIKWTTIQAGVTEQNARPDITTPKALINWLFVFEDHEIQVFDHNISLAYAKAVSKVASESPLNHNILGWKKNDPNEDQEMDDMSNNGSPGALCLMNPENDVGRKRKEFSSDVQESRVKQVRLESSVRSVGNEVINISSDDDMES